MEGKAVKLSCALRNPNVAKCDLPERPCMRLARAQGTKAARLFRPTFRRPALSPPASAHIPSSNVSRRTLHLRQSEPKATEPDHERELTTMSTQVEEIPQIESNCQILCREDGRETQPCKINNLATRTHTHQTSRQSKLLNDLTPTKSVRQFTVFRASKAC